MSVCLSFPSVPVLLDLLSSNISANHLSSHASVHNLDWSREGALDMIRACDQIAVAAAASDSASGSASPSVSSSSASTRMLDPIWRYEDAVVIAADVVYPDTTDATMDALFQTADGLLGPRPTCTDAGDPTNPNPIDVELTSIPSLTGSFLCSYSSRDSRTTLRLLHAARRNSFECRVVPPHLFLPQAELVDPRYQPWIFVFKRVPKTPPNGEEEEDDSEPSWFHQPLLVQLCPPKESESSDDEDENPFGQLEVEEEEP